MRKMTKCMSIIFDTIILQVILSNKCSEIRKIKSTNHPHIILDRVILVTLGNEPPPAVNEMRLGRSYQSFTIHLT